jgi:HK97 family phage major capsid protein
MDPFEPKTAAVLREQAAKEAQAARDIQDKADAEGRSCTTEEDEKINAHLTTADRCERDAKRKERLEAAEARLNAPQDTAVKMTTQEKPDLKIVTERGVAPMGYRAASLRAFRGPNAEANAYRTGKWMLASLLNNAEARQWCRDHNIELRVQTEGVNSAGGFIVPAPMEQSIIDLREEYGVFRREARVLPMSSDSLLIPRRAGGVTAYFVGETGSITESDKTWNQVELVAKKLGALTRISTDLSEDAIINVADDLASEMAYAFAVKEDACGIDGDGTSTYGGMIGLRTKMNDGDHDGSYYDGTANDNWSEITAAQLAACMGMLPSYAINGAKWYCSQAAKAGTFDRLALAAGGNNVINIAAGAQPAYAGFPIVVTSAMPSVDAGAALDGLIGIIFGNLRLSTTLGDRRGITVKVSTERYLEYDQIGIQATERFCIVNHDIGTDTAAGPVVGMRLQT